MSNQIHLEPVGSGKFSADVAGVSINRIGDQVIVDAPQGRVSFNPDTLRTNSEASITSDYKGGFFIAFPATSSSATGGAVLGSAASGFATGAAAAGTIMGVPTLAFFAIVGLILGQCTFFLPLLYFPIILISWIPLAIAAERVKRTSKMLTLTDLLFSTATLSILSFPLFLILASMGAPQSNVLFVAWFIHGMVGIPLCATVALVRHMILNESIKNKK